jgi:hypothetical protein
VGLSGDAETEVKGMVLTLEVESFIS